MFLTLGTIKSSAPKFLKRKKPERFENIANAFSKYFQLQTTNFHADRMNELPAKW